MLFLHNGGNDKEQITQGKHAAHKTQEFVSGCDIMFWLDSSSPYLDAILPYPQKESHLIDCIISLRKLYLFIWYPES